MMLLGIHPGQLKPQICDEMHDAGNEATETYRAVFTPTQYDCPHCPETLSETETPVQVDGE